MSIAPFSESHCSRYDSSYTRRCVTWLTPLCVVLVPYHDVDTNPFRTHLAAMALTSEPLMSLVLAYSGTTVPLLLRCCIYDMLTYEASHRSQLLQVDLPQMRLAGWAQSVFPALRESLLNDSVPVSDVTLAMAVILVALEIMSPGAFGQGISWREHIAHARGLLAKRLDKSLEEAGEGFWFIQSWLGYVDVMGGLMAGPRFDSTCKAQTYFTLTEPSRSADDLDEIDCMMGISVKCARLLGQVAALAKQCQGERFRLDGQLLHGWTPQPAVIEQALSLEQHMMESLRQSSRPCTHVRASNIHMRDLAEMAAMNEAFHWAGLIHLRRRVLGRVSTHPDIQGHVQKIVQCLDQIRVGGAAETRCLFPIFTAGCEAAKEEHQTRLLGRLLSAEKSGMKQVRELDRDFCLERRPLIRCILRYTLPACSLSKCGQPAAAGKSSFATNFSLETHSHDTIVYDLEWIFL